MTNSPWRVAAHPTSNHPADRMVDDLVAALRRRGIKRRRIFPTAAKFPLAHRLQRHVGSEVVLLPLMGPKWWLLEACRLAGYGVVPFCWDVWEPDLDKWVDKLSQPHVLGAITVSSQSAEVLGARLPDLPVRYLPEAMSPSRFLDADVPLTSRSIDVLELGRKHNAWHEAVSGELRDAGRTHRFEARVGDVVFPSQPAFDAGLMSTKVSICFTRRVTHPCSAGGFDVLTQRYLESAAAGCLVLGHNPADLVRLFGYEPAIEVDWSDPVAQVVDLLERIGDFQDLTRRNRKRIREVGTWDTRAPEVEAAMGSILTGAGRP